LPRGRLQDAKTVACPDFLDHQESQERTANPANQDHLAHLVSLVVHHWKFADPQHHRRANHAHLDHQALEAHLANPEHLDQTETQATPERMEEQAHPAHLDQTDHPAPQARMEKEDQLVIQPQQFQPRPEIKAQLAKMDHQDQPVKMAPQDPMADPAQLVPKDPLAQQAHLATMALPAKKDHQVPMDPKENQVFAPNIAPPMAVSSSRMEQDGKRHLRTTTSIHIPFYDIGTHLLWFNNSYPLIVILLASMFFAPSKQQHDVHPSRLPFMIHVRT